MVDIFLSRHPASSIHHPAYPSLFRDGGVVCDGHCQIRYRESTPPWTRNKFIGCLVHQVRTVVEPTLCIFLPTSHHPKLQTPPKSLSPFSPVFRIIRFAISRNLKRLIDDVVELARMLFDRSFRIFTSKQDSPRCRFIRCIKYRPQKRLETTV